MIGYTKELNISLYFRLLMLRYLRMSIERFDNLQSILENEIMKTFIDTNFRKAVSTMEKLVVTLRYLATGCSQQNISYSFRMAVQQ